VSAPPALATHRLQLRSRTGCFGDEPERLRRPPAKRHRTNARHKGPRTGRDPQAARRHRAPSFVLGSRSGRSGKSHHTGAAGRSGPRMTSTWRVSSVVVRFKPASPTGRNRPSSVETQEQRSFHRRAVPDSCQCLPHRPSLADSAEGRAALFRGLGWKKSKGPRFVTRFHRAPPCATLGAHRG
jgi:hypothetical protein